MAPEYWARFSAEPPFRPLVSSATDDAAHFATELGGRTLESPGYRAGQIVRKRIEQFFGWGETLSGL
jgi:hypothetical protein